MGGVFDFFIIINNMTSSWSSCSSASSSTCTSCSLVLLGGSAMSTLPYVWLTCAFGHNKRGETQLVCWCAFLESAWCPAWNQRRQPGAWGGGSGGEAGAYIGWGVRAGGSNPDRGYGRVKSGLGKGPVKSGSGMRAGQIRNGKRAASRKNKNKRDAGFYQRLFTGLLTKVFTAPSKNLGFYLGLAAPGFYLGKNLGRSPGVATKMFCVRWGVEADVW